MQSAKRAFAITTSDTVDLTLKARAIYVGGAGNISVILSGETAPVVFNSVPAGTTLWIYASRVRATGTTATNLVGLV